MSSTHSDTASVQLIATKLYPPHQRVGFVERPHLLDRLNDGLKSKVSRVVAPAGFGKTTLISTWLHQSSLPTAWLSLDEYDNDLSLFLHYAVASIQMIFPEASFHTLSLLRAPQLPTLHYLATALINDMSAPGQEFILVLDDYHFITNQTIHQLVTRVIDHLPPTVHLVLSSRTELPLPLARLRSQQQITEIRAADLCFSYEDTQVFLNQALNKLLTPEIITALHTRTEGWIAGLQLATLALRGRVDEADFVQTFAQSDRHVVDYLMEEVLARQPAAVQNFLVRTAILNRFCAPLCEAIMSEEAGASAMGEEWPTEQPHDPFTVHGIVDYLERANLFIVPLDDQADWHRYHHLFHAMLRHQMQRRISAAEIQVLHRRASAWLADHGWIEEAVQHALAGGDDLAAAHLVAQQRHDLLNREEWRTLERWLSLLPEAVVQRHPPLLMTKAWILNLQFTLAAAPPLLQAAATHLPEYLAGEAEAQLLLGEMEMLWSQLWYWQNAGQRSQAAALQALERLPESYLYARSSAFFYLGLATQMVGQSALAVHTLREALDSQQTQPSTFAARMFFALTFVHYLSGELPLMHQMAQELLQVAMQADLAMTMGWAHYMLGIVHYEWDELEDAARHFTALVDLRYRTHVLGAHYGWLGLAWTRQAQGDLDQAHQQVTALRHFHHEMNNLTFLPTIYSFQARLALQQGDGAAAQRWAQAINLSPPQGPLVMFEIPHITRAKVMVSSHPAPSGAETLAELAQLLQMAESTHNTMRQIELLSLYALAEAAQGERELALATLQRAVVLAMPGGFIRTFVDQGPLLAGLLYELAARGVEAEYLGHVLAAFPPTAGASDPAQQIRRAAQAHLIEPLTERESEVLLHLGQKRSNKAIARALDISALTVKKHTIHLYQKLGVNSRQQAVARARALGILPLDDA